MGPRSDERGNKQAENHAKAIEKPSMGPRSDERGNKPHSTCPCLRQYLQWGRAQMSAEMNLRGADLTAAILPSMGPRSDERGNAGIRRQLPPNNSAFNGAALR